MKRAFLLAVANWHDLKVFLAQIKRDDRLRIKRDADAEVDRAESSFDLAEFDLRNANARRNNAWYEVERLDRHRALGIAR